eukprot:515098_1
MDNRSVQTAPILDESTKLKRKKLTKREKKLLKKKRKFMRKHGNKKHYFAPIDKSKSITLHLVHRSTNDPLLDIPDEPISEWVLEPEVKNRNDFERIQKFFSEYELEDTIPHHYRTDEFIEKTSVKSMPILKHKYKNINSYNYNYEQHYRSINDSNFIPQKNNSKNNNNQVLEQYIFEQDYENDYDETETYDSNGNNILQDENYKDYINLLESDNEIEMDKMDEKYAQYEYNLHDKMTGDLQDDFVFKAMGLTQQNNSNNERVTIGDIEPYGARFAKWNEMDMHYDKYYANNNINIHSESLYDKTINHLMNIQNAKDSNYLLEDISEENEHESGQFMDAEDDEYSGSDDDSIGGIIYNPNMSLLDNQFEIMLSKEYNDEYIGELDDDMDELKGEFGCDISKRFSGKNKKKSLRYQYYMYLKNKKRRITNSLKKSNKKVTLQLMPLMGIDIDNNGNNSDEIIFFSDSDSGNNNDEKMNDINYKDLDSDNEARINAEIDEEFKKKEKEKWDVESILSQRTNHENHPIEIKVNNNKKENDININQLESIMENNCNYKMDNNNNNNDSDNDNEMDIEFSFGNICDNNIIKQEN